MGNKTKDKNPLNSDVLKILQAEAVATEKSTLGVSIEYKRTIVDDRAARAQFKQSEFEGKQTIIDTVTGETIHRSHVAAKAKYGQGKYSAHAAETDHIVSLERGHSMLSKNPFLTDADVKSILNDSQYNYRETAKNYNASKQGKSELAMAAGHKELDKGQLFKNEAKAQTGIFLKSTTKTATNISSEFEFGATQSLEASAIPLIVYGTQNLLLVARGEKELSDAVADTSVIIAKTAVSGGLLRVSTTAIANTFKNSSVEILQKLGNSNQLAQIITISVIMKDSVVQYINGEITGSQFMEQIGEKGVGLISGSIGAVIGQGLIPIPFVGAVIGSMVVSIVCVELYKFSNVIKKAYIGLDDFEQFELRTNYIADQALHAINQQQEYLQSLFIQQSFEWDSVFNSAFQTMIQSAIDDNVDGVAASFNKILSVFGQNVTFGSLEDFNDFFEDEKQVLQF